MKRLLIVTLAGLTACSTPATVKYVTVEVHVDTTYTAISTDGERCRYVSPATRPGDKVACDWSAQ
jgi:uncharacterized lipoprotein YmbA